MARTRRCLCDLGARPGIGRASLGAAATSGFRSFGSPAWPLQTYLTDSKSGSRRGRSSAAWPQRDRRLRFGAGACGGTGDPRAPHRNSQVDGKTSALACPLHTHLSVLDQSSRAVLRRLDPKPNPPRRPSLDARIRKRDPTLPEGRQRRSQTVSGPNRLRAKIIKISESEHSVVFIKSDGAVPTAGRPIYRQYQRLIDSLHRE